MNITVTIPDDVGWPNDPEVTEWKFQYCYVTWRSDTFTGSYYLSSNDWTPVSPALAGMWLIAVPVSRKPKKVKVKVLLTRDQHDDAGCEVSFLGRAVLVGGIWYNHPTDAARFVPDREWPFHGCYKIVIIEVDDVAPEIKE